MLCWEYSIIKGSDEDMASMQFPLINKDINKERRDQETIIFGQNSNAFDIIQYMS